MKKTFDRVLCTAIVLLSVLSSACTRPISESSAVNNLTGTDENKVIYGASSLGSFHSISEQGIFSHDVRHLKYYDPETKESYVICSKSNCRHSDSGCSGWYEPLSAVGLALYGKNVYVFKRNESKNSYDLICMDISGNSQKTVCTFNTGSCSEEGWHLSSIYDVCYVGGMVWFKGSYSYRYGINSDQTDRDAVSVIGVNLSDGKHTVINKLPENEKEMTPELYADCSIEYISKDFVMIQKIWNAAEKLTKEEFMKAFDGGSWSEFKNSEDPYYAYLEWHSSSGDYVYSYLLYDVQNGSLKEFEKGVPFMIYDDGKIEGIYAPYIFSGTYDNKILYCTYDRISDAYAHESGMSVFIYDPKSGKRISSGD